MKTWIHHTLVILGLSTVVAGTALLDARWRASHMRSASTSLKTLASCSDDFRINDRDWNRVNGFWRPSPGEDPAIKRIEISIAAADPPFRWPESVGEFVEGTRFLVRMYWRQPG